MTLFAAAKAGLSLAIIDPFISSPQELEFILNDSQSKMLIFDPKVNGFDRHKLIRDMFPELETCKLSARALNCIADTVIERVRHGEAGSIPPKAVP